MSIYTINGTEYQSSSIRNSVSKGGKRFIEVPAGELAEGDVFTLTEDVPPTQGRRFSRKGGIVTTAYKVIGIGKSYEVEVDGVKTTRARAYYEYAK